MKIEYKTLEDRDRIIKEQMGAGKVLLEEQNHFDGNFLIFGDEYPVEKKQENIEEIIERKIKEMVMSEAIKIKEG